MIKESYKNSRSGQKNIVACWA